MKLRNTKAERRIMKMPIKIMLSMVAGACLAMWTMQVEATPIALTVGDANYIGSITPDHPASATDEAGYIDYLITLALNGSGTSSGQTMVRSGNSFSPLDAIPLSPSPVPTGFASTGSNTGVTLTSGYEYLAARYGGQGGGIAYVWYINGLGLDFTVPAARPDTGNGISGINVFDPPTAPAPDSGTTALLLGLVVSTLGLIRRKLS